MTQADKISLCCIIRAKFTKVNNLVKEGKIAEAICLIIEITLNFCRYELLGIKCDFKVHELYITEFTIDDIKVTL